MRHGLDAAEEFLEFIVFLAQEQDFLLGQAREIVMLEPFLEFVEVVDSFLDGREVCKGTAEPALFHIKGAASRCMLYNRFLGLSLGSEEQDSTARGG